MFTVQIANSCDIKPPRDLPAVERHTAKPTGAVFILVAERTTVAALELHTSSYGHYQGLAVAQNDACPCRQGVVSSPMAF